MLVWQLTNSLASCGEGQWGTCIGMAVVKVGNSPTLPGYLTVCSPSRHSHHHTELSDSTANAGAEISHDSTRIRRTTSRYLQAEWLEMKLESETKSGSVELTGVAKARGLDQRCIHRYEAVSAQCH